MVFSFFSVATESTSNNYCLWISNSEEEKTCCDTLGVRITCFCFLSFKKQTRQLISLIFFITSTVRKHDFNNQRNFARRRRNWSLRKNVPEND